MTKKVSEAMLMAFVDGELDAETAEEVRGAIAGDPSLARRAEAFRASRQAARDAFAGIRAEPVPARLREAVLQGASATRSAPRAGFLRTALPLAASLALIAGIGGYMLGQAGGPGEAEVLGGPALAEAVGATPGGAERTVTIAGREVTVTGLATYPVNGGRCRTFDAAPAGGAAVRGVGCSFGEDWHVDLAVALPSGDGFSPAAANVTETLDAYLDGLGAGPPLDDDDEEAAQD